MTQRPISLWAFSQPSDPGPFCLGVCTACYNCRTICQDATTTKQTFEGLSRKVSIAPAHQVRRAGASEQGNGLWRLPPNALAFGLEGNMKCPKGSASGLRRSALPDATASRRRRSAWSSRGLLTGAGTAEYLRLAGAQQVFPDLRALLNFLR